MDKYTARMMLRLIEALIHDTFMDDETVQQLRKLREELESVG